MSFVKRKLDFKSYGGSIHESPPICRVSPSSRPRESNGRIRGPPSGYRGASKIPRLTSLISPVTVSSSYQERSAVVVPRPPQDSYCAGDSLRRAKVYAISSSTPAPAYSPQADTSGYERLWPQQDPPEEIARALNHIPAGEAA